MHDYLDAKGSILIACDRSGEVVGAGRTNFSSETSAISVYADLYSMEYVGCDMHPAYTSITTKFMVAPIYRCGTLSIRIAKLLYENAYSHGICYDFIDCNPHLEKYFHGLGYKTYRERIQHAEYGDVMPMLLDLHDIAYLKSVSSPLIASYMALQKLNATEAKSPFTTLLLRENNTDTIERLSTND